MDNKRGGLSSKDGLCGQRLKSDNTKDYYSDSWETEIWTKYWWNYKNKKPTSEHVDIGAIQGTLVGSQKVVKINLEPQVRQ